MPVDDAEKGRAFKSGPIQRRRHMLERLVGRMTSYVDHPVFFRVVRATLGRRLWHGKGSSRRA